MPLSTEARTFVTVSVCFVPVFSKIFASALSSAPSTLPRFSWA